MSHFLDPTGHSTFGIGICARCARAFYLDELQPDPNAPGLMVCLDDRDVLDPYRLPARPEDQITLPFCRPDEPITGVDATVTTDTGTPYTFWATDLWATDVWATDLWA